MPEILPSIHQIDLLFQGQPGTIAAYLLTSPAGDAALIETGPSTTSGALLDGLRAAGVDPARVTDVLVTHIHLDHSGGAGVLLRDALPRARVHVHPVGQPHLVDPARLLRSAARLYGEHMDLLWGEVAPVPNDRIVTLEDGARLRLAGHEVEVLYTPGHAAHHVAVHHLDSGAVFAGDVAGVRVPGVSLVNPPTVPPEFDLTLWEESIERLLRLAPRALLPTHFGLYSDVQWHLEALRRRLREWVDVARADLAEGRTSEQIAAHLQERDAAAPNADTEGLRRLDLTASYGLCVAGIIRYLER